MAYHGRFDKDGIPLTLYDDAVTPPPEGAVELTDEQYQALYRHQGTTRFVDGAVQNYTPPQAAAATQWPVSKLAITDRLAAAGLLRKARLALKLGQTDDKLSDDELHLRGRWEEAVTINSDDTSVRQVLTAIGADPDVILSP
jgi:hypothetical protein